MGMQKMMTILYPVKTGLYVNLTNRCPCACTFCIRKNDDKVYDEPDSLWLEHEPSIEEVKNAFSKQNMKNYSEVVFCGYGEPTEALDTLLQTARFVKKTYDLPTRLNTNGLGNLINEKDVPPLFKGLFDSVSISLNSSSPQIYLERIRPKFKEKAYPAMLDFAKECTKFVPDVTMTTVHTTISEQDEEQCAKLCKELGVNYRIREFVPPSNQ